MRSAVYFAGTIITLGLYVAAAAVFAFTPTWIGVGVLAIAAVAAAALVAGDRQLPAR
ncbi:MAG TPA: hypothetical protein VF365_03525 [Candidatus Limnocylindria bacterium]